jgi:HEAT repeat protein
LAQKTYKTVQTVNPFSDAVGHDPTVIEPWVKASPVVTDALAERLVDSNLGIRLDAAKALGILKAENTIPKMLEGMKPGDPKLRIALLRSLYKIGDPSVDASLLPYLNDANKDVRDETILTLGLFRSRKALPEIQRIYDRNPDTKLRLKALEAISLIGDPSSKELFLRNLRDPDAPYRQYAAEGLARVADKSLVEGVSRSLLSEPNENTQLAMSFALYRMGREEYLDKLVATLNSHKHHEQVEAYFLEMGKPLSFHLVKYLNNEHPQVRARLCLVLGQMGERSIIDKISPLLKDPNAEVISEATLAIRRLSAS